MCKTKITGDCVVNNNTYYHPHCMRCHVCDDPLRGSYTFFQNKPICERDFKQAQTVCSVCSETIEGTYYQLNDRIYCEQCSQSKDSCSKCGSQIDGKAVKTTGSVFHPQCFNCEVCDKSLNHKQFTLDSNNRVYCPECYTTKFAALCSVCGQGIVPREGQSKAPRIRALDRDFHPECFKCEDCGLVLDSRVKGSEVCVLHCCTVCCTTVPSAALLYCLLYVCCVAVLANTTARAVLPLLPAPPVGVGVRRRVRHGGHKLARRGAVR